MTRLVGELLVLHPTASLHVSGHSMGAALANLCALDLKFKLSIEQVGAWAI